MCEHERLCYVNIIYINVASRNLSRTIHIFQLKVTSSWNVCKSVSFLLVARNKNLTWKHYSQHWLGGRIGPLNTSLINHGEIIDIFCQLIFCEVIYDWFWTVLRTKYDGYVATKIGFLFVLGCCVTYIICHIANFTLTFWKFIRNGEEIV